MLDYTININYIDIENTLNSDIEYRNMLLKVTKTKDINDMIKIIDKLYDKLKDNELINNIIKLISLQIYKKYDEHDNQNNINAFYMCFSYQLFHIFYDILKTLNIIVNNNNKKDILFNKLKLKINNL